MLALTSSRCAAFSAPVRVQPARQMMFPAPGRSALVVEAAVPKKKVSKSKKNIRKAAWKKEVLPYVEQALFKVSHGRLFLFWVWLAGQLGQLWCCGCRGSTHLPLPKQSQAKLALKEGSRDSTDKDMVVGGQAATEESQ